MNYHLIRGTPDAGGNGDFTITVAISSNKEKLEQHCLEEYKTAVCEMKSGMPQRPFSWADYFYIVNTKIKII
jgi:hypothetical protein